MVDITDNELREFVINSGRPIPGQSLTNDPEVPAPHERPPQFTTKEDAMNYFFTFVTEEKRFKAIMESLEGGAAVMDLVQLILVQSFQNGEINPDMMLMLAEPLAQLLIGLAEREGIRVVIVDDPDDPENEANKAEMLSLPSASYRDKLQTITSPQDDEELNIEDKIQELPSLMAQEEA